MYGGGRCENIATVQNRATPAEKTKAILTRVNKGRGKVTNISCIPKVKGAGYSRETVTPGRARLSRAQHSLSGASWTGPSADPQRKSTLKQDSRTLARRDIVQPAASKQERTSMCVHTSEESITACPFSSDWYFL